jgi:hypothetical protein
MTTAGLSIRRSRSWTRSDPEGDGPGGRRHAGSRRCAVGDRMCGTKQRREGGATAAVYIREKSRGRSGDGGGGRNRRERAHRGGDRGSGTKKEVTVYRSTGKHRERRGGGEKPRRGRQAAGRGGGGARRAASPRQKSHPAAVDRSGTHINYNTNRWGSGHMQCGDGTLADHLSHIGASSKQPYIN